MILSQIILPSNLFAFSFSFGNHQPFSEYKKSKAKIPQIFVLFFQNDFAIFRGA
jgi:hypothetical protein